MEVQRIAPTPRGLTTRDHVVWDFTDAKSCKRQSQSTLENNHSDVASGGQEGAQENSLEQRKRPLS